MGLDMYAYRVAIDSDRALPDVDADLTTDSARHAASGSPLSVNPAPTTVKTTSPSSPRLGRQSLRVMQFTTIVGGSAAGEQRLHGPQSTPSCPSGHRAPDGHLFSQQVQACHGTAAASRTTGPHHFPCGKIVTPIAGFAGRFAILDPAARSPCRDETSFIHRRFP
jgi:hypothetical protein